MSKSAPHVVFKGTVKRHGGPGFIELPFDPKAVFGKVRAPVKVTLTGYTFRTTIAAMGGPPCVGASHESAGGSGPRGR